MPDSPAQIAFRLESEEAAVAKAMTNKDFDASLTLITALYKDIQAVDKYDARTNNQIFSMVQAHDQRLGLPSLIVLDESDGKIHLTKTMDDQVNKLYIETAPKRLEKELKAENATSFEDAVHKDALLIAQGPAALDDKQNQDLRHHIHSACATGGWRGQERYFKALDQELQNMKSPYRIVNQANTQDFWETAKTIGWFALQKDGKSISKGISY